MRYNPLSKGTTMSKTKKTLIAVALAALVSVVSTFVIKSVIED